VTPPEASLPTAGKLAQESSHKIAPTKSLPYGEQMGNTQGLAGAEELLLVAIYLRFLLVGPAGLEPATNGL
jgi:hypothetical protein